MSHWRGKGKKQYFITHDTTLSTLRKREKRELNPGLRHKAGAGAGMPHCPC